MTIPHEYDLHQAPELAILTAAETTLAIVAQVLATIYPEITDECTDPDDYTIAAAEVARMRTQATELIASIRRYRDWILDADPELF